MNENQSTITTRDEEVMDAIRDESKERIYVAGVKYDIAGWHITAGPDDVGEVMVVALERTFANDIMSCPKCERGEKIQVPDDRFAGGNRWECNNCAWVQEA